MNFIDFLSLSIYLIFMEIILPDTKMTPFAIALQHLLSQNPMTQGELAKIAECSQSQISRLKTGQSLGTESLRKRIADAYGYSLNDFIALGEKIHTVVDENQRDDATKKIFGILGESEESISLISFFKEHDIDADQLLIERNKRFEFLFKLNEQFDRLNAEDLNLIASITSHFVKNRLSEIKLLYRLQPFLTHSIELFEALMTEKIKIKSLDPKGQVTLARFFKTCMKEITDKEKYKNKIEQFEKQIDEILGEFESEQKANLE